MHGQSAYTQTKQKHLKGLLNACKFAWNPLVNGKPGWAHPEVVMIDCTSGTGHAADDEPGSPLIINEWAQKIYGDNFRQLCCERTPTSYVKLAKNNLPHANIMLGPYEDIAPLWLDTLGIAKDRNALGFIYCDPNGAKDLVDGLQFFKSLRTDRRFQRLDFIFHWSITAYNRNAGAGSTWADASVLSVLDELVGLKRHAYMREPLDKWQWVFMHLLDTDKVQTVWKNERIMPYSEWRNQFGERFVT